MTKSVAIIGGGFAGLAAGVYLAEKGFIVNLFEKRPILGGRAYSVIDSKTGDTLDNGQHLMMGCYHHTLAFLEKIGTRSLVEFQEKMEVSFADKAGNTYALQCPNLPAPLHMLIGLLRLKTLDASEKWSLMKMMAGVKKLNPRELESLDSITCEQWLTLWQQSEECIRNFWEPLILATLNETPQISSAQMLAVVLREALLKTKEDSKMVISKVGLSDLYTNAAQKFIEEHGGKIHLRRGVKHFFSSSQKIEKIILEDGSEYQADFYLNSSPAEAFFPLLDSQLQESNFFKALKEMPYSPILGVNLWFDREITDKTFVGILDSPVHWVFNKRKVLTSESVKTLSNGWRDWGPPNFRQQRATASDAEIGGEERQDPFIHHNNYLSLVISGAHKLKDMPAEDLLKLCLEDIRKAFPKAKEAKLLHHRILKETKATPSFGIGSSKLRPSYETPLANLFLAGDWTNTGLPATIEGAVKSGYEVADLIFQKV